MVLLVSVVAGVIVTYLTEGTWQAIGVGMVVGAVSVEIYHRKEAHRKASQSQAKVDKQR